MILLLRNKLPVIGLFFATSLLGLILSVLIVLLPAHYVLLFIATITAFSLIAFYPLMGFCLVAALVYDVIPSVFVPEVPLGGARVRSFEIITAYTVLVTLLYAAFDQKRFFSVVKDSFLPMLLVLFFFLSIAFANGFLVKKHSMAMTEARMFIAIAALPFLNYAIARWDQARRFPRFLQLMGLIISLYVIAQSSLGIKLFGSRVDSLAATEGYDVVRTIVGSAAFIQAFSLYYSIAKILSSKKSRLYEYLVILFVIIGLLGTFTRGVWVGVIVGGGLFIFLSYGLNYLIKSFIAAIALGAVLITVSYPFAPKFIGAAIERASGIGREIESGSSFGWRKIENSAAIDSIQANPILGTGLGGEYKLTKSSRGSFDVEYSYIHNSYLYFPLKMGIAATVIPFFIALSFIIAANAARGKNGRLMPLAGALTGVFYILMQTSFTSPELHSFDGLFTLAILLTLIKESNRYTEFQT